MDFDLVLRSRHSVRVFSEKPVTRDILRKIVEDAGRAPSWVNAQEWHVYMATEKTLKNIRAEYTALAEKGDQGMADYGMPHREEWSKLAQEHMAGFHNLIAAEGVGQTMAGVEDMLFNAPAVAFITMPKGASRWAVLDLGGFTQTMQLSAFNKGLGSIAAYNLVKHPEVLRRYLDVPETDDIVVGVALGYESDDKLNQLHTVRELVDRVVTFKD